MKKLHKSRKACAEALLNELQQKFPAANFTMIYYGEWELDANTYEAIRDEHGLTKSQARQSVKLYWDDGPSERTVHRIASKYERRSSLFLDSGHKWVDNIGFDENGEPVLMGFLHTVMKRRDLSDDGIEKVEAALGRSLDSGEGWLAWENVDL